MPGGSAVANSTDVCHFLQQNSTESSVNTAQPSLNLRVDNNNDKNAEHERVVNNNNVSFNDCGLNRNCSNKTNNSNTVNDVSAYINDIPNSDTNPWIPFPCLAEQSNHNLKGEHRKKAEARKLLPEDTNQENSKWQKPITQHVNKHSILPHRGGHTCSPQKSFKETTV